MRSYKREITYRFPLTVQFYIFLGNEEYPVCPRCRCSLEREYMNFCDRCGQKLIWKNYGRTKRIAPNR